MLETKNLITEEQKGRRIFFFLRHTHTHTYTHTIYMRAFRRASVHVTVPGVKAVSHWRLVSSVPACLPFLPGQQWDTKGDGRVCAHGSPTMPARKCPLFTASSSSCPVSSPLGSLFTSSSSPFSSHQRTPSRHPFYAGREVKLAPLPGVPRGFLLRLTPPLPSLPLCPGFTGQWNGREFSRVSYWPIFLLFIIIIINQIISSKLGTWNNLEVTRLW